jgi:hypothetical protein
VTPEYLYKPPVPGFRVPRSATTRAIAQNCTAVALALSLAITLERETATRCCRNGPAGNHDLRRPFPWA